MYLRFVIKQDWKEWGFWSIKQTAQPSWWGGGSPDNSGMHIPYMWMKITGCFEGARENAKWSQTSLIFLPGTENASLECFPFPSKLYLLLNEHYNCFKRNDYRDESSTIQSLWDPSCLHPMSLSIPYLRCALICISNLQAQTVTSRGLGGTSQWVVASGKCQLSNIPEAAQAGEPETCALVPPTVKQLSWRKLGRCEETQLRNIPESGIKWKKRGNTLPERLKL